MVFCDANHAFSGLNDYIKKMMYIEGNDLSYKFLFLINEVLNGKNRGSTGNQNFRNSRLHG